MFTPDPLQQDPPAAARVTGDGVPVARPIGLPHPEAAEVQAERLLLKDSTAGAAWVDIARVMLFLVVLEMLAQAALGVAVDAVLGSSDVNLEQIERELNHILLPPLLAFRAVTWTAVIAGIIRSRRQSAASLGFHGDAASLNLLIGAGATVVVYALILLTNPLLWSIWPGKMEENIQRILQMVPKLHPFGFVAMTLMIGVYEEVFFRGFLMTRLRRATGSWIIAVVISTTFFTSLHAFDQTAPALVSVAILSLVFSVVTIWRRSILPAIMAHTLFNLSQLLWLYVVLGDTWE